MVVRECEKIIGNLANLLSCQKKKYDDEWIGPIINQHGSSSRFCVL
jgi:hypothetical protein